LARESLANCTLRQVDGVLDALIPAAQLTVEVLRLTKSTGTSPAKASGHAASASHELV
jgi:hypothetical protein